MATYLGYLLAAVVFAFIYRFAVGLVSMGVMAVLATAGIMEKMESELSTNPSSAATLYTYAFVQNCLIGIVYGALIASYTLPIVYMKKVGSPWLYYVTAFLWASTLPAKADSHHSVLFATATGSLVLFIMFPQLIPRFIWDIMRWWFTHL